jgi:hypothetical protein
LEAREEPQQSGAGIIGSQHPNSSVSVYRLCPDHVSDTLCHGRCNTACDTVTFSEEKSARAILTRADFARSALAHSKGSYGTTTVPSTTRVRPLYSKLPVEASPRRELMYVLVVIDLPPVPTTVKFSLTIVANP